MKYLIIGSILTIAYSIFYPVTVLAGSENTQSQAQQQTQNNNQNVNVSNSLTNGSTNFEPRLVKAATPAPTPAPTAVPTPNPTPQVIAQVPTQAKELPKTGPAEAAWALAALLPLGLKLRGLYRNQDKSTPNSIWIEKEMNK